MKIKLSIFLLSILLSGLSVYSQNSPGTKNDKPGTPQSLLTNDNTPENHVQITNNATQNQTNINRPSESNTTNNTTQQTITANPNKPAKPNLAKPNTLTKTPPANMQTTTNSSAVHNGISNASKPLRNN